MTRFLFAPILLAVSLLTGAARAEVEFAGFTWYISDQRQKLRLNPAGQLEWKPKKPGHIIVHFPSQKLRSASDAMEIVVLWKTEGNTTRPDRNILKVTGTGDFRIGLFDSAGRGHITKDSDGKVELLKNLKKPQKKPRNIMVNEIFRGYLGYQARIMPNVDPKHGRWYEPHPDGRREPHFPGRLLKRIDPATDRASALLSGSKPWGGMKNNGGTRDISGFGVPPGKFAKMTLRVSRRSPNTVQFTIDMNGARWWAIDRETLHQPQAIDTFAIQFPNPMPYDLVTLALPKGKSTIVHSPGNAKLDVAIADGAKKSKKENKKKKKRKKRRRKKQD